MAINVSPMGDTVLYFSPGVGEGEDGLWDVFVWNLDPQEAGFHSPK